MNQESTLSEILGKIHRRLLPFLLLMYVLAFLDRANLGFAGQQFQAATGLGVAPILREKVEREFQNPSAGMWLLASAAVLGAGLLFFWRPRWAIVRK